ncbi:YhgE/Pip domain-containing protein [Gleimia hominis]|uniref:YhgE/Pip domain-containing protein n=1 Tax=Gleimia hominis TaxID=595468 RepID=UPI0013040F64|nr:ABC transporter permease [Gleimia hominis]WIK64286.1 ABC transporter permease [Gleimia hominis]
MSTRSFLGKKKPVGQRASKPAELGWLLALVAPVLGLLVAALVVGPLLGMNPHNLPVALVNADQKVAAPNGQSVGVGEKIAQSLLDADQDLVEFHETGLREPKNSYLADYSGYYAEVRIPKDLSTQVLRAQTDAGQQPKAVQIPAVTVTINQGRNPLAAQSLTGAFTAIKQKLAQQAGAGAPPISLDIKYVNEVPTEWGFKAMIAPVMLFLLTFIASIAAGFAAWRTISLKAWRMSSRFLRAFAQLCVGAVGALIAAFGAVWLAQWVTGISLPFTKLAVFLAVVSFAFVCLTVGGMGLFGKRGLAVPILCMVLGMSTLTLPRPFLPGFWRDWIYPWIPPRFAGEGVRAILFANEPVMNESTTALLWVCAFGIALLVGAAVISKPAAALVEKAEAANHKDTATSEVADKQSPSAID